MAARAKPDKKRLKGRTPVLFLVILCLSVVGCLFFPLLTETTFALGVSPPFLSLGVLTPGEAKDFEIGVLNTTDFSVNVEISVIDFLKDEFGQISYRSDFDEEFSEEVRYYSMASWIEVLEEMPLTIAPQTSINVPLRVTVPENAEPGAKFVGISVVEKKEGDGNVLVLNEILQQVFAFVGEEEDVVVSAAIDSPEMTREGRFSSKFHYKVTINNTGNTHLDFEDIFLRFYHNGSLVQEEKLSTALILPVIPGTSSGRRVIEGEVQLPSVWRGYDVKVEIPSYGLVSKASSVGVFPFYWLMLFVVAGTVVLLGIGVELYLSSRRKTER